MLSAILDRIPGKWLVAGVAALALGLIIKLAYSHYTGMQQQIIDLEASNAQLQVAIEIEQESGAIKDDAIREWRMAAEESQLENERLARVAQEASAESRRLNAIFAEHDLTRLTLAKPGLIERRVNSGTARALRMLECASRGGCDAGGGGGEAD